MGLVSQPSTRWYERDCARYFTEATGEWGSDDRGDIQRSQNAEAPEHRRRNLHVLGASVSRCFVAVKEATIVCSALFTLLTGMRPMY